MLNFFEQQESARRSTRLLMLLFCLAIVALLVATNLLLVVFLQGAELLQGGIASPHPVHHALMKVQPWQFLLTSAVVISGIASITLYKWYQLRRGGRVVAESLGGTRLHPGLASPLERRLLNIVEEMAIASGTPVPAVYLMDEPGINAFAAGYTLHDAVIGVTRGALEQLNRDELQGVIGHEFSHIHNGDMRLNTQLLSLLHGILFIYLSGRIALRMANEVSSHGKDSARAKLLLALLGIGLMALGAIGMLVGRLIKAAVSREREFLADASAVQFTRNPTGIANALKRIGNAHCGSQMQHRNADCYSHLFFGSMFAHPQRLFATHPPLDERIRRLEPEWDGHFPDPAPQDTLRDSELSTLTPNATSHDHAADAIEHARTALQQLPPQLQHAATALDGAMSIVVALLLSADARLRQQQLDAIHHSWPDLSPWLMAVLPALEALTPAHRLPLLELLIPTLHDASPTQRAALQTLARQLIDADGTTDLSEWLVYQLTLYPLCNAIKRIRSQRSLQSLAPAIGVLLSFLAHFRREGDAVLEAFERAEQHLGQDIPLPRRVIDLPMFSAALEQLRQLQPLQRPLLLKACLSCLADGPEAQELMRAVALALDCPLPPTAL